jgi:propanol-preferring alcohol dehydrogenase
MSPLIPGLSPRGKMMVLGGSAEPISVQPTDLIFGTRTISGSLTGSPIENEDNLAFGLRHGITPMTEVLPLADAPKAYERMMSGRARFRIVLDTTA